MPSWGFEVLIEEGPWTAELGFEATCRLLAAEAPPTAILAGSNRTVLGVLRAVRGAGLRVPATCPSWSPTTSRPSCSSSPR